MRPDSSRVKVLRQAETDCIPLVQRNVSNGRHPCEPNIEIENVSLWLSHFFQRCELEKLSSM